MMRTWAVTILIFGLWGCGGAPAPAPDRAATAADSAASQPAASQPAATAAKAPATQPAAVLPNDGTRKVGDVTRCVVSDEIFTVTETTPKAEHEGKTYYVCCPGCRRHFARNPARFLGSKTP